MTTVPIKIETLLMMTAIMLVATTKIPAKDGADPSRTRTTKMTTVAIKIETFLIMTAIMLATTTTMNATITMPAMGGRRKHGSSDLSPCEMHGSSPCRSPC